MRQVATKSRRKWSEKQLREAFEEWITSPPIEASVDRYPKDAPEAIAWPGNYIDYPVQLAWCAWKEAKHAS